MPDIKDNKSTYSVFDTDISSKLFIGGGKSDATNIVGAEFADITGGTQFDAGEIEKVLSAMLTSKGWSDSPGLEGVSLLSMSATEVTIRIDGNGPSSEFITLRGDAVEAAIDAIAGSNIDIKNSASQVAIFDTDTMSSIWIGGGKSDARNQVGQEFADITGGSRINTHEVDDLLKAVLSGSSWNDETKHGLEGVSLRGLTDEGFTLTMTAAAATEDTIIFNGAAAVAAIAAADGGGVDIKNNATQLGVFDVAEMNSIYIGGGKSDASSIVGAEFAEITGGTRIDANEILEIFDALTSGSGWNAAGHGLDGVSLVGLDSDSFAIALDTGGPAVDYILFTNVDELDGASAYGFFEDPMAII